MNSLEDISGFLSGVKRIREMESDCLKALKPESMNIIKTILKKRVLDFVEEYKNLESPEKEYLESLKNFYGLNGNPTFQETPLNIKYDYSAFENGRISLDTSIDDMYFSTRTKNCLKGNDINYLGELLKLNEKQLKNFKSFGSKCLKEVKTYISKNEYELGTDIKYMRPEFRKR